MIHLYQFPGSGELTSLSPFCVKAEAFLRLSGVDFVPHYDGDPRRSPTKKLPYLLDDSNGRTVADSTLIAEYVSREYGVDLDRDLDSAARAHSHLLRRTLEEGLYFSMVWSRWSYEPGWAEQIELLRKSLPRPLRRVLPLVIRRYVRKQLYFQGTGRLASEDIERSIEADLSAIEASLGDGPFVHGPEPTSIDTSLYGFLLVAAHCAPTSAMYRGVSSRDGLMSYLERMREKVAR